MFIVESIRRYEPYLFVLIVVERNIRLQSDKFYVLIFHFNKKLIQNIFPFSGCCDDSIELILKDRELESVFLFLDACFKHKVGTNNVVSPVSLIFELLQDEVVDLFFFF